MKKSLKTSSKTSNYGGARKGAGRPISGRNTQTISFSIHKDFVEPIRLLVKKRVQLLKKQQKKAQNLKK